MVRLNIGCFNMRQREFNNDINTATPSILLYDVGGSQTINSSGVFLTWDNIKSKTSHFQYTINTDRITLLTNSNGLFKITVECSINDLSSSGRTTLQIYKNGVVVEGTYSRSDTSSHTFVAITFYVYLEINDYIQVYAETNSGTSTTIANTSRVLIEFLNMKGWDGNTGGRLDYKGGLER